MADPIARRRLKKKMLDRWENEDGRIVTDDYLVHSIFVIDAGVDVSHLRHSSCTPMRSRRPSVVVTHGREVKGGL